MTHALWLLQIDVHLQGCQLRMTRLDQIMTRSAPKPKASPRTCTRRPTRKPCKQPPRQLRTARRWRVGWHWRKVHVCRTKRKRLQREDGCRPRLLQHGMQPAPSSSLQEVQPRHHLLIHDGDFAVNATTVYLAGGCWLNTNLMYVVNRTRPQTLAKAGTLNGVVQSMTRGFL